MQVLDHEPQSWFLFEANGELYLDANCNHGAFGYSFMIRLTTAEVQRYRDAGRDYLSWLAQDIHNGAPILSAILSPYKTRKRPRKKKPKRALRWRHGRRSGFEQFAAQSKTADSQRETDGVVPLALWAQMECGRGRQKEGELS